MLDALKQLFSITRIERGEPREHFVEQSAERPPVDGPPVAPSRQGFCIVKHTFHISHFGHVPIIERLVERPCGFKHDDVREPPGSYLVVVSSPGDFEVDFFALDVEYKTYTNPLPMDSDDDYPLQMITVGN